MTMKVYCPELKRLVTGEDVWEMRYGKQRTNQALTFKCPDPACSAQYIVRNCAPYLDAWETGFRRYPRSKHDYHCNFTETLRREKNARIRARTEYMPV